MENPLSDSPWLPVRPGGFFGGLSDPAKRGLLKRAFALLRRVFYARALCFPPLSHRASARAWTAGQPATQDRLAGHLPTPAPHGKAVENGACCAQSEKWRPETRMVGGGALTTLTGQLTTLAVHLTKSIAFLSVRETIAVSSKDKRG